MEKWKNEIERKPSRIYRNYPSFSSTLLDAIYRSIDETDSREINKNQSKTIFPEVRRIIPPLTKPTSSSSETSSNGRFSSSHTESTHNLLPPIRTIRTTAPSVRSGRSRPIDPPDRFSSSRIDGSKEERQGSIRSCLRDLKKSRRSPSSPGARLTNFLSSLFAAKSKVSAETPATAKRTVRFCPASVILGEDRWSPGDKWARRSKMEEEEEEDLFELKNLAAVGRFRGDLPVYETTVLGKFRGVSRGVIV